jgi:hypothetical protein
VLTIKIVYFVKLSKRTSQLRSSRRDGKKIYMEHLIRSPDEGVNCPLPLYGKHNFWVLRIGVLALREHENFWPPTRTSGFRSPNQGESKLDPNSFKLVGNLENKSWRDFLLG